MLKDQQLQDWCAKLQLSTQAQQVIQQVRSSAPARRVQGRRGNVRGSFPSRKMGHTIQYESLTNELSAIYLMEYHETEVLEYWDQPPSFTLRYQTKAGVLHGHTHTPDFFVLRQDGAGWEEWKLADELPTLAEKMPARYVCGADAVWRCLPGEEYARQFGLSYRVRTSAEINWILQRNLRFLDDYWRADDPSAGVRAAARQAVLTFLAAQPGATLRALCNGTQATTDEVFLLLSTQTIFVDLCSAPLTEPEQVRVYPDQAMAVAYAQIARLPSSTAPADGLSAYQLRVGMELSWDGKPWRIANVGVSQVSLLDEQNDCRELPQTLLAELLQRDSLRVINPAPPVSEQESAAALLRQASPAALQEANRRLRMIEPYLQGTDAPPTNCSTRTRQRWLQRYRAAQSTHGLGYLGLLPAQKGNHQSRLSTATRTLLQQMIEEHYETLKQKGKFAVYGQFLLACERQSIAPVSYKTFAAEIQRRPRYEQTCKRAGPRAAYVHEPFYHELQATVPRHGERPFEIVHIDHTELDLELICLEPRRNLGRPWATFLTDAFSRRLLAVLLLYDPPSYRTNMMILRECVRRHQRFPQTLVVDGGKDFHSLYFDGLLAAQECTKRIRPAGKARFGSVIERLFGVSNQQFVHNLQGNTQSTRNVRQVTRAMAPATQAIWTLPLLYERFCEWAYEIYDTSSHGTLEQSPRAAFATGQQRAGERPHRWIQYDEAFRLLTLPTTRSGLARVIPGNGVKINNRYYWAHALRHPEVERQRVPVRYDPYDAGQAYAFVKGVWITCHAEHYHRLHGHTERELMLASSELRKRQGRGKGAFQASARQLALFLDSVEAQESLMLQRLRDFETKKVLAEIEGQLAALPASPPSCSSQTTTPMTPALPPSDNAILWPDGDAASPPLYSEY